MATKGSEPMAEMTRTSTSTGVSEPRETVALVAAVPLALAAAAVVVPPEEMVAILAVLQALPTMVVLIRSIPLRQTMAMALS